MYQQIRLVGKTGPGSKKTFEAIALGLCIAVNQTQLTGTTDRVVIKGKFNRDLTKIRGTFLVGLGFNSPKEALDKKSEPLAVLNLTFKGHLVPTSLNY